MQLKVERKSQFGIQSGGKWYNPSKFDNVSLDGVEVGDTVEVEVAKDKYITKLTVLSSLRNSNLDNIVPGPVNPAPSSSRTVTRVGEDPQKRLEIARMNANTAIWGSPLVAALLQNSDFSEAVSDINALIDRTVSFTLTGSREVLTTEKTEAK